MSQSIPLGVTNKPIFAGGQMSKFSEQMTLTEVAAVMGISRQRVKQIETVALEKLRKNPKVRGLYEGIIDGRMGSCAGSSDLISVYAGIVGQADYEEELLCLLYTSPSPRDGLLSRMPSSA